MKAINVHQVNFDKHPMVTFSSSISQLAEPLKRCDISHFSFARTYETGERLFLTSHPNSAIQFIRENLYLQAFCSSMFAYKTFNYLWMLEDCPEVFKAFIENNIGNGITLVRPNTIYCEIAHFAGSANYALSKNFLINNINWLERFLINFRIKANSIIQQAENFKLIYPNTKTSEDVICKTIRNCEKKGFALSHGALNDLITQRESECLAYLERGLTAKEIAKHMHISHRTVETYIARLKKRFGSKNRLQLIRRLSELDVSLKSF